jgi:hypothetical protein
MKLSKLILLAGVVFLFSSCALNYYYTWQPESENTGQTVVIPVSPTTNTYVKLGDSLIIKNKYVRSLTIENLPEGTYHLEFLSYNSAYKNKLKESFVLNITQGTETTQIVSVPPVSSGYWIYAGLITSTVYTVLYLPLLLGY